MDFKRKISPVIADIFLFCRNCVGLIFSPYDTMRKISLHSEYEELIPLYLLSFLFFLLSSQVRQNKMGFISALTFYVMSIFFFSLFPGKDWFLKRLDKYIKTWTYTLVPTLIWFYSNIVLYVILPPPRTMSILGQGFSIFFLAFSVSLLVWKLILVYLSLRFSSRVAFIRIMYYILVYLIILIPLSLYFYQIGMSRIPFV